MLSWAKPDMALPAVLEVISLNDQGEGIRNAPAYAGLKGLTRRRYTPLSMKNSLTRSPSAARMQPR